MQKYLTDSSATFKAGISSSKRIFKVTSGQYAGRIVILAQTSPTDIKLTHADYPYSEWSSLSNIVGDSVDFPFDAVMDENNNIYLAYTLDSHIPAAIGRSVH